MRSIFTKLFVLAIAAVALPASSLAQTYCSPVYTTGCTSNDLIQNVSTQNGITNFSNLGTGCSPGAYTYYSNMTVSEQIGGSFDITVQAGSTWSQGFRIWVDWNQDGDFSDPGEDVWNSGTSSTAPFNTTITIPAGAVPGTTRMRVRCMFANVPSDPCASQTFGEVEDYNLDVISPSAKDVQFVRLPEPFSPPRCYTTTETVKARIKNTGLLPLDFLLDPVTVTVNVTGGANNATLTQTVNSGLLAVNDSMDVTVSATYDMTAFGTYTFNGYTSMANDSNQYNDTLLLTRTITTNSSAGTLTATPTTVCQGSSANLSLNGQTGTHVWETNTSGTWVTTTNTSNPLTVTPTVNTSYRALVCGTTTSNQVTVTVTNSTAPTTTPGTRCGYGPVTMNGSGSGTLAWYDNPTGGNSVNTGTSYTINTGVNDTFYVENQISGGAGTAGLPFNSSTSGTPAANKGLEFTVNNTVMIDSVAVYAIASSGTFAEVNIAIENAITGAEIFSTGLDSVPAVGGKGWVVLQTTLAPGMYRMTLKGYTNAAALYLDPNPGTFPYNATTGDLSITGGWSGSGFSPDYNYFYDWRLHSVCTSTRTQVIAYVNQTPPVNLTVSDATPCAGDTIVFNSSSANTGYTYTYSGPGLLSTTGSSVQGIASSSGNYIVSAVDGANCAAYDTVMVTTTSIPGSFPIASVNQICSGGSTQFNVSNASSNYTYSWTPAAGLSNPNISNPIANPTTGNQPDTIFYSVTTTHPGSGCTQTNSMSFIVYPGTDINLGADDTVCQYSNVVIDAGPNYNTYKWNNGEIGQVRIINSIPYTQTITVTVTNQYGCADSDTKKYVVVPRPSVNLGSNQNICVNQTTTLNAAGTGLSYLWSTGETTSSITVGPNATTGNYWVTVTNSFGCSHSDTTLVTVLPCTDIDENSVVYDVAVYPNPNNGNFFIEINAPVEESAVIQIMNLQGQLIEERNIRTGSGVREEINLSGIATGMYLIKVSGKDYHTVKRVIIR